jgi:AraC-like DNA-binding protein
VDNKPYPNPIHLSLLGIKAAHKAGYTVDRRLGSEEYLIEYFESPVVLEDAKRRRPYSGNAFILYTPRQRQYFRADSPLTHTWFQVSGEGVAECIERYNIPVNQAIEVADMDFLPALLEEARRHAIRKHRYWQDAVTEIFRSVFRRLARALFPHDLTQESPYRKQLLATMHSVRAAVYKDLARKWTVDDMAAMANMSVQRFAVVYRSFFETGPIDDLIDVRLRHADLLLKHLPITVVAAAHHSGFNTGSYFHVLFRKRMNRSPRALPKSSGRFLKTAAVEENLFESCETARRVHLLYIRPVGHWSFDQEGEAVIDDLRRHSPAQLHANVSRTPGRQGGSALVFDGASHALIPETIVDTSRSYTVCAWLTHRPAERMTAISVGNWHHGAFYLQYIESEGGYKFAVTVSDRDPLAIFVLAQTPTKHGGWNHVVGVHDAENQEIRLYINGRLEGRTAYRTPWRADGSTYFGCCQVRETFVDFWAGAMDDIRIYDSALADIEIGQLYKAEQVRDEITTG